MKKYGLASKIVKAAKPKLSINTGMRKPKISIAKRGKSTVKTPKLKF